jgi:hypothetical protein
MTSRPSTAAPILAVLAVVLVTLTGYVGCYLGMLGPDSSLSMSIGVHIDRYPAYRFGGESAEWLFSPANYVDQMVRPKYWHEFRP